MLATQRKTEYKPAPIPRKRVVKMEGNVAYINTGVIKKRKAFRGESAEYSQNEALRSKNEYTKHKVRKSAVVSVEAKAGKSVRKSFVSTIAVIFIAFCALALLVSRYAVICSINSENNKLKSDINSIEVKIEELKVQMELQDDLESVLDTAVNDLGMTYPGQNQKIRLDMS